MYSTLTSFIKIGLKFYPKQADIIYTITDDAPDLGRKRTLRRQKEVYYECKWNYIKPGNSSI